MRIDDYIQEEFGDAESKINTLREKERQKALQNISGGEKIFRINIPTGGGKTLTGLSVAEKLNQQKDGNIIYALPYTTIIDQTDNVIRDIYGFTQFDEEYTVHHHLADTRTKTEDTEDERDEELLAQTWKSNIVLTTFVQLFESLARPNNRQSLKLPSLYDSTIIIDEPQALPEDWWQLVGEKLIPMLEGYNCHIILMTATQPQIAKRYSPYAGKTLADGSSIREYIKSNRRVSFNIDTQSFSNPITTETVATRVSNDSQNAVLFVGNTVSQVSTVSEHIDRRKESLNVNFELQKTLENYDPNINIEDTKDYAKIEKQIKKELTDRVKQKLAGEKREYQITLTANLRPIEREILFDIIETSLDQNHPLTVLSTQLIEAGVDVSFDSVYRDIAPISSIIQSAGRCNRSFENDTKNVYIFKSIIRKNDNEYIPAHTIYKKLSITHIEEILQKYPSTITEEKMITDVAEEYFQMKYDKTNVGKKEFVENFENGKFEKIEPLIKNNTQTVLVSVNSFTRSLYEYSKQLENYNKYDELQRIQGLLRIFSTDTYIYDDKNYGLIEFTKFMGYVDSHNQYNIPHGRGLTPVSDNVENRFL